MKEIIAVLANRIMQLEQKIISKSEFDQFTEKVTESQ